MIIVDSSTLILLAKSGMLDIMLNNLKEQLTISKTVCIEATIKNELFDAKLIKERINEGKIKVKEISNNKIYKKLLKDFNIGEGEAQSITLCLENKVPLIADDKKAINCCRILNIRFITALNLLVRLYKTQKISKAVVENILKKLQFYGRYDDKIIQKIKEEIK